MDRDDWQAVTIEADRRPRRIRQGHRLPPLPVQGRPLRPAGRRLERGTCDALEEVDAEPPVRGGAARRRRGRLAADDRRPGARPAAAARPARRLPRPPRAGDPRRAGRDRRPHARAPRRADRLGRRRGRDPARRRSSRGSSPSPRSSSARCGCSRSGTGSRRHRRPRARDRRRDPRDPAAARWLTPGSDLLEHASPRRSSSTRPLFSSRFSTLTTPSSASSA